MFLLTEGPRLFYVDPKEKILKVIFIFIFHSWKTSLISEITSALDPFIFDSDPDLNPEFALEKKDPDLDHFFKI